MPWKEHRPMDLRREFVLAASAPQANIAELCREFGISRTNGYKWLRRYRLEGTAGLQDRSRRPRSIAMTDGDTVVRLLELRRIHTKWGPKKLRELLVCEGHPAVPSVKTIGRVLDRVGEPRVRKVRKRRFVVLRSFQQLAVTEPNDVWTVDFKGWWRTRNRKRVEPLTVRDAFSRFVLCLQMLSSTSGEVVKPEFERLFQQYGLPRVVRVDNGAPFACTSAPAGLSRLSAWWTALGIQVSFSRPAHPQDNGAHERMHADVAAELEATPEDTSEEQQHAADRWRELFNRVRPHEALHMKTPADVYRRSPRLYRGIKSASCPDQHTIRRVDRNGCVRYAGRVVFVSESVRGYDVAVRTTRSGAMRVLFYGLDLGTFELASAPRQRRASLIATDTVATARRAS
jgi:putative transposase